MIRVVVAGAAGKLGREIVKGVLAQPDMRLVGGVSPRHAGVDLGDVAGLAPLGLAVVGSIGEAAAADVLVDVTNPHVVMGNASAALQRGMRPLIGSTGLSAEDLARLEKETVSRKLGTLVAPNFALGALLMMRFAREAAKYFEHAEIVEMHHDQKLDAPSGTALETARAMRRERPAFDRAHPDEVEKLAHVRGGDLGGIRIHSVRLPGMLAHQEVHFGGEGQVLTIRHDALSRDCYMPGVLLGIRKLMAIDGMVVGLEHLL